jgi:electron transfer flavoprotein alpha/beta subunit
VQSEIGGNMQKIERMYIPEKTKKTEYLEGSASEIAKKLVDKLRNEIRVL